MKRNKSDNPYQLFSRTIRPSTAAESDNFLTILSLTNQHHCYKSSSANRSIKFLTQNSKSINKEEKSPELKPHILHHKLQSSLGSITSIPSISERILLRNKMHSSRLTSKKEKYSLKIQQIAFRKVSQEPIRIHHQQGRPGKLYISKFICKKLKQCKEKTEDLLL